MLTEGIQALNPNGIHAKFIDHPGKLYFVRSIRFLVPISESLMGLTRVLGLIISDTNLRTLVNTLSPEPQCSHQILFDAAIQKLIDEEYGQVTSVSNSLPIRSRS